jgi:hypothetical protein
MPKNCTIQDKKTAVVYNKIRNKSRKYRKNPASKAIMTGYIKGVRPDDFILE